MYSIHPLYRQALPKLGTIVPDKGRIWRGIPAEHVIQCKLQDLCHVLTYIYNISNAYHKVVLDTLRLNKKAMLSSTLPNTNGYYRISQLTVLRSRNGRVYW